MGSTGYTKHRKSPSSFSIFSIFASCCSNGADDMSEDGIYVRRTWRSDEDGRRWTAEPGIDRRASAFIDRFRTRVSDPERQALSV
ncbi:Phosphatase methylesterase 1 [Hibiscus syriacus]|uniref:Phosphatase methylesterase 1 n=1 Tax=Hibiscus syriacus TaxID=106335 RepID=A0A6A3BBC8_HIBSY|nr:Phosphatase methylesterase 1 [Hibiscus syriacus]